MYIVLKNSESCRILSIVDRAKNCKPTSILRHWPLLDSWLQPRDTNKVRSKCFPKAFVSIFQPRHAVSARYAIANFNEIDDTCKG